MTKIIYFVTSKSIIIITTKAAKFVLILGPSLEFTKKVTKMINLVNPSSEMIGMLFNYCFGKASAVSIEWILWFGFSIVGGATCNPRLIGLGAPFSNMVIDKIIG